MLHRTCLWPHGPPRLSLPARMTTLSLRASPPPWHLQAHQVSFAPAGGGRHPRQQGRHRHCSCWHHRGGTGDLSKRGWPLERWGASVPHGPSAPVRATGAGCAGGGDPTLLGMSVEGDLPCLPLCCIQANAPVCSSFRITAPRLGKGPFP